jgi:hypothetical protein
MFNVRFIYGDDISGHICGYGFNLRMDTGVKFQQKADGMCYENDGDACMTTGESSVDMFLMRKEKLSKKDMFTVVENLRKQIMVPYYNNPLLQQVLDLWTISLNATAASFGDVKMDTDHPSWTYDLIQAHEDSVIADFVSRAEMMLNIDGSSGWKKIARELRKMHHSLQDPIMGTDENLTIAQIIQFINLDNMLTMVGVLIMRKACTFMYQKYSPSASHTSHLIFNQMLSSALMGSIVKVYNGTAKHSYHVYSGDGLSRWINEWHFDEDPTAVKNCIYGRIKMFTTGDKSLRPIYVF